MNQATHHALRIGPMCYPIPPMIVPQEAFPLMSYDPLNEIQAGQPVHVSGFTPPLFVSRVKPRPDVFTGVVEVTVDHERTAL